MPLTADHIQRALSTVLATSATGDPAVIDVTRISDGWEADVWSFATHHAAGRRNEWILRLYHGHGAAAKAALEFRTMERLRAIGYPVPLVQLLDERETHFGQPFMIMERIAGPTLGRAHDEAADDRQRELATFARRFQELTGLTLPEAERIL